MPDKPIGSAPSIGSGHSEFYMRLAGLIEAERLRKRWKFADLAKAAAEMGFPHMSDRTAREWAAGTKHKKELTKKKVEDFAKLFGCDPSEWVRNVFLEEGRHGSYFCEEHQVIEDQKGLAAGDAVWIITCRGFLEAVDPDILELVRENLARGIIYVYFFPSEMPSPYGPEGKTSYEALRRKLLAGGTRSNSVMKLCGFPVDPHDFPYFSPLHTIVHYIAPNSALNARTLVYIEADEQPKKLWYRMSNGSWKTVESKLRGSVPEMADLDTNEYRPINAPYLKGIRSEYIAWFSDPQNLDAYDVLRGHAAHNHRDCVSSINHELGGLDWSRVETVRYLDIGCGDGEITRSVATSIARRLRSQIVKVTGLDPSNAQLRRAERRLESAGVQFHAQETTLEDFSSAEEYDVITAVHSLYVVDLAYLKKIYQLLRPGGIACLWIGAREDNAVNSFSDEFDRVLRSGQRRNYAEEVIAFLHIITLARKETFRHEQVMSKTPAFVSNGKLTPEGLSIAKFCALAGNVWDESILSSIDLTRWEQQELPLKDHLIVLRRSEKSVQRIYGRDSPHR